MTNEYDAIICGGGPAGSSAALSLARHGRSALVLDRARFPRTKLCGGLLTWKSTRLLATHFGLTPDDLIRAGVVNFVSDRFAIHTFSRTLAKGMLPFPFHFADRAGLDALLLDRAAEAGAVIEQATRVTGCDPKTGEVRCADGRRFRGRYVIGADGANSRVRAAIPTVDRERMHRYMAPAIEIALPPEDFPRPVDFPELYVGFLEAGYGWVFPNRDRVVLGICGLRRNKNDFSALFDEFLAFLGVDPGAVTDRKGHLLPYGNYLSNPAFGRTLLAGDAGGFVEPLFGEGIFYALCTGRYAGEAVADGVKTGTDPGPAYAARLGRYVLPELAASDRLRWLLFKGMGLFGPGGLAWFVGALEKPLAEMVHGMRSYRWLKKKEWDFKAGPTAP
ncbi:MAG: geranylgeranyl reductase family protein [Desulfovibrionaceae bacterium]|nr:geranylgeranyl reductase family protein [Desulfovibrionaceae bacterium]